jgi:hypothetical protein
MASLVITSRPTRSGPRYIVRYRLGGRSYPIVHAGSFKTMREAKIRRYLVAGEIAAGRNPRDLLAALTAEPTPTVTLTEWTDRFLASRIDFAKNTADSYRSSLKKVCETLGDYDPSWLGWSDISGWIAELVEADYKPATIGL